MSDLPVTLPLSVRINQSFKELAQAAVVLNQATDEFTKVTAPADELLKTLNLGVDCWVRYKTSKFEDGSSRHYEIGYAKIAGRWGIALRTLDDEPEEDVYTNIQRWQFTEGPRSMRVDAIQRLPELLAELAKKTEKATRKVKDGTEKAREVVAALEKAATEAGVLKPKKGAAQ